ncbi:MAG TPA: ABC transporter ATP-binding protein [archaeon]|nr:ABC transporter ATP-binding protein [archaeon]
MNSTPVDIDQTKKRGTVVEVHNLFKSYGTVQALRDVSFEVHKGEVLTLVGPNGSGKTTIVEILEGLRSYDAGSFSIFGQKPSHPLVKQSIGVFLQESQPMDNLTPREILRLHRSFYNRGLQPEEALARVSLQSESGKLIRTLSTGQKRRLDIAVAIINDPLLVFLDEPTVGLDPGARRSFWEIIRNLRTEGCSVILTTHYMDEAEALSDRIAFLSHGRILALDTPSSLVNSSGIEHSIQICFVSPIPGDIKDSFTAIPGSYWNNNTLLFTTNNVERDLPQLFKEIHEENIQIAELIVHRPTIEDVFHLLAGGNQFDG